MNRCEVRNYCSLVITLHCFFELFRVNPYFLQAAEHLLRVLVDMSG